jgi:hypothetical protein
MIKLMKPLPNAGVSNRRRPRGQKVCATYGRGALNHVYFQPHPVAQERLSLQTTINPDPHSSVFPVFAHSLNTFFRIFPVLVFGNSLITSTLAGTMNLLIVLLCFAQSITSSPDIDLPSLTVTYALGRSPNLSSGIATTPASRMSG